MNSMTTIFRTLVVCIGLVSSSYSAFGMAGTKLSQVESSKVCMVNDQVFPNDQIPVKVGAKMYFGCCAMCEKTLSTDAQARTAVDPVSKKPIDKADAIIGADETGKVFYFESEENLRAFNAQFG